MKTKILILLGTTVLAIHLTTRTYADSAIWDLNPGSGDWNTATNWTPVTVPNGPTDTATFGLSNTTSIVISQNTQVSEMTFTPGSSSYLFTVNPSTTFTVGGTSGGNLTATIRGSMIVYNSNVGFSLLSPGGFNQHASLNLFGSSTAGGQLNDGGVTFHDTSTAQNIQNNFSGVSFLNNSTAGSATLNGQQGNFSFGDSASAGSAHINTSSANISFGGNSTAGSASVSVGDISGSINFTNNSSAGSATISCGFGSLIQFSGSSQGGTASIVLFSGFAPYAGAIFQVGVPSLTIGSLAGDGGQFPAQVGLGTNNLTVGSNNMSTTFMGLIGGAGGSLTKIGTGNLTLSGANTYTGGTTVNAGALLVNNTTGSGTGSGAVHVNSGTLGGTGTIAGAVTIGTGSGPGAFLSPGQSPGTLTIQSALTLNSDATFVFELNSNTAAADKVIANGVTITGAQFSFTDLGNSPLAIGTVFTVIDDTAVSAISGTFSNLPNGSAFTVNGNTFLVNYSGGNGNDLTLTVSVPEPSTLASLLAGFMVLGFFCHRLRRINNVRS